MFYFFGWKKIKSCQCYGCGVCKEFKSMCDKSKFIPGIQTDGHPCNECKLRKECTKQHDKGVK